MRRSLAAFQVRLPKILLGLIFLLAILGPSQQYAKHSYNNFIIFTRAGINLPKCISLYIPHSEIYRDIYRYSPVFAYLMHFLIVAGDLPGLIFWSLLNTIPLFAAIYFYFKKGLNMQYLPMVLILLLPDWLTSIQNSQSNALIAGLVFWAWIFLKEQKLFLAAFLLVLCAYTKFYGAALAVLFLFYPKPWHFIVLAFLSIILLGIAPLLTTSPACLFMQYKEWFASIIGARAELELSIFSFSEALFNTKLNPLPFQLAALVLLLAPLILVIKAKLTEEFIALYFSSVMLFLIVFNTMAESPTYIIAATGIAVYIGTLKNLTWKNYTLVAFFFLFSALAPSDLYPLHFRKIFFEAYKIKVIPVLLIWVLIQIKLWRQAKLPAA